MKKLLATSLAIFSCLSISSQSLTPQVTSASGSSGSAGPVQLSWTVSQPFVTTFSAGGGMLSQGFHQTYLSNDPLPIVLLSFEANRSEAGTEVLLRWTTLREWNNAYFTIERSIDRKDFSPLFEIEAAGSSNRPINYTATDNRALPCASYYRLRQTDFDGSTSLSEPVVIPALNMNEGLRVTVFPNPAGEETTLLLNAGPGAHEVELRDAQGRYIRTESFEGNRKRLSLMGLSGGVYVLRLRDNRGEMKYLRILKQD